MRLEARKYLHDIGRAADLLAAFTAGKAFADYARDAMMRAVDAAIETALPVHVMAPSAQLENSRTGSF